MAWAYPEFIGYKYSTCITCHYNSQGNGPINDYGRALWGAEIAGRLWSGNKTSEQLGESSGFLGKTELPWWFRPGIKARNLWFEKDPGSKNSVSQSILMQAEANMAIALDKSYKYMVVASYGYDPTASRQQGIPAEDIEEWISREHYFRWQTLENLFLFIGKMDKAYGLRISDHTAFNRSTTGNAQSNQVHGIMAHWISEKFEWTVHPFLGDLMKDTALREKGVSTLLEYELKELWRVGLSAQTLSSETSKGQRFALHSRNGLGFGSSFLFEVGLVKNNIAGVDTMGYYLFSELMQKVSRGYHVFFMGQSFKDDMTANSPTSVKAGFGILAFPMQRVEFRVELQNVKTILNSNNVPPDSWNLLNQIHLSL